MEAHQILGVSKTASEEQIRAAYKALALKWHPDRQRHNREEATIKFVEINEANRTMLRLLRRARRAAEVKKSSVASDSVPSSPPQSTSTPLFSPSDKSASSSSSDSDGSQSSYDFASSSSYSENTSPSASTEAFDSSERPASPADSHSRPPNPRSEKCDPEPSSTSSSRSRRQSTRERSSFTKNRTPKSFPTSRRSTLDCDPDQVVETLRFGRAFFRGAGAGTDSAKKWVHVLPMSLEEIYHGKTYYFRIIRYTLAGKKRVVPVDVYVPPGTRAGTEIVVADIGNERKDGTRQDICFLVKETEHPRFTRIRDDLLMEVRLPWIDSLNTQEGEVYLQGVDDMEYMFPVNYCVDRLLSGTVTLPQAGMPRQNGTGRGKIVVRWEIASPASSWDAIKNILKFRNTSRTGQ